jgi:hypothetical protein
MAHTSNVTVPTAERLEERLKRGSRKAQERLKRGVLSWTRRLGSMASKCCGLIKTDTLIRVVRYSIQEKDCSKQQT